MTNVMLVDDEMLLVESLEIILTYSGKFNIVGKASNGNEALDILSREQVDVMLVDLNMPQMGGIELISRVKENYPSIKMIVLTTFYDEKNITEALAGGALGYLLKDSGKDSIINAINQAITGQSVLDQKVFKKLTSIINSDNQQEKQRVESILRDKNLTDREKEICLLIAQGCTNDQIASTLYISEGTVKNYISSIYDKFHIHDRAKLALLLRGK